jgi:hypothetical protein
MWYDPGDRPEDQLEHHWGEAFRAVHALYAVADELQSAARVRDLEIALARFQRHLEAYLYRTYELREHLLDVLREIAPEISKKKVGQLKDPKTRDAAAQAFEAIAPAPMRALIPVLQLLDRDVALRNQQTHRASLHLMISVDGDLYEPENILLDVRNSRKRIAPIRRFLRKQMRRMATANRERSGLVRDQVLAFLELDEVDPWRRLHRGNGPLLQRRLNGERS